MGKGLYVLGQDAECDLIVGDDPYVSGRHACVKFGAAGWTVEDLGSTNGTYLRAPNGEYAQIWGPTPLQPGWEIGLGTRTWISWESVGHSGMHRDGPTLFRVGADPVRCRLSWEAAGG